MIRAAAAVALAILLAACSSETPVASDADCALPEPEESLDASLVDEAWALDDAVATTAARDRGGFIATFNIPYPVSEGLSSYREKVAELGYEITAEDDEGFEGEIYFQGDKEVGAIQIRRSRCDDRSVAFVNVIATKRRNEQVAFPVPSGARTPTPSASH